MRPIVRGKSPRDTDFGDYRDAFPDLVSRLGPFCSYCERRISTQLAVEHIQPKDPDRYPKLRGNWDNFLLACVNCNSTKKDQDVVLSKVLLPDRDNTAIAYDYAPDGIITVNSALNARQQEMAAATLTLTGLDKPISEFMDDNGITVAIDRVAQRQEAWGEAERAKTSLRKNSSPEMSELIIRLAVRTGYFSIWMTVFRRNPALRQKLITAFAGTATDCFDAKTQPISPRPDNGLKHAGKV